MQNDSDALSLRLRVLNRRLTRRSCILSPTCEDYFRAGFWMRELVRKVQYADYIIVKKWGKARAGVRQMAMLADCSCDSLDAINAHWTKHDTA